MLENDAELDIELTAIAVYKNTHLYAYTLYLENTRRLSSTMLIPINGAMEVESFYHLCFYVFFKVLKIKLHSDIK